MICPHLGLADHVILMNIMYSVICLEFFMTNDHNHCDSFFCLPVGVLMQVASTAEPT